MYNPIVKKVLTYISNFRLKKDRKLDAQQKDAIYTFQKILAAL